MGMIVAIYRNVDADKKHQYKGMMIATALATFLTGVTEPIEYMFMFVATPMYLVYSLVQGAAFAMADVSKPTCHSFGSIEFLTRTPLAINAGIGMDIVNFYLGNCSLCRNHVLYRKLHDSKIQLRNSRT